MGQEYKLKTGNQLKCSACGNDHFNEESKTKDGKECYVYTCTACSHVMKFMSKLEQA